MHLISQQLAVRTQPGSWEPNPSLMQTKEECAAEIEQLKEEGYAYVLRETGAGFDVKRFCQVHAERFGDASPNVVPFVESLLQVASDLLLELPNEEPPKSAPKVNLDFRPAPEPRKASKEVSQFAHLYNSQIMKGTATVKPYGGYVTLEGYEYPAQTAEKLLNEAISFGLIR